MDDPTLLSWIERAANVSLALVAIGVVGEFVADLTARPIRRRIEAALHLQIAQLEKSAADANNAAGEANRAAAEASARAAKLQDEAEKERRARIELEARLAWRRISQTTHDSVVPLLKPYKGSIVELTEMGDVEPKTFAADILKVLRDSGWNVRLSGIGVASPTPYGLQCSVNESLPGGRELASFLEKLPTARVTRNDSLRVVAQIFVALKPPP